MSKLRKVDKAVSIALAKTVALAKPGSATAIALAHYRRHGMQIVGEPNYVSSKVWFDGTDYSLISLGDGCTISSFVRFLTHDWSPYTAFRAHGIDTNPKAGRFGSIEVGDFSFVGTGCVLLPGTVIGRGAIVGAGSAVRGHVEPNTIVVGSPAVEIGRVDDFLKKRFPSEWERVVR